MENKQKKCRVCEKTFASKNALRFHILKQHRQGLGSPCYLCSRPRPTFDTSQALQDHVEQNHSNAQGQFVQTANAFGGSVQHYLLKHNFPTFVAFRESVFFTDLIALLTLKTCQGRCFGMSLVCIGNFYCLNEEGLVKEDVHIPLRAKRHILTHDSSKEDAVFDMFQEIQHRIDNLEDLEGSGWHFDHFSDIIIELDSVQIMN